MEQLPEPAVPAAVYDEEYYRERCAGFSEWVESEGTSVSGIYPGFLTHAGLRPGEIVIDVGCGRGELLATAIEMGASKAFGIEYSSDALAMAKTTLEAHGVGDKADVRLADARSIPLPDACADLICYVDVVEHLTPDELHASLVESRRLLKPGGRVVAHTMPNRLIYDVTYKLLRAALARRKWPADPRKEGEHLMHVNEQSPRSLRDAFTGAGFEVDVSLGAWMYLDFVPSGKVRRIYHAMSKVRPLEQFAKGDLWAVGRVA